MAPRSDPWLRYANQGATRSLPVSDRLRSALSFLPDLGVEMEVFSGGQPAKGSGGARVGSTRHDHGESADVFFYKDGRKLDWSKPDDRQIFKEIVRRGRAGGITGFGAGPGYMQQGSMHIGFGKPAVWGAGGKGANAPDWLRSAYAEPSAAPHYRPSASQDTGPHPPRVTPSRSAQPTPTPTRGGLGPPPSRAPSRPVASPPPRRGPSDVAPPSPGPVMARTTLSNNFLNSPVDTRRNALGPTPRRF